MSVVNAIDGWMVLDVRKATTMVAVVGVWLQLIRGVHELVDVCVCVSLVVDASIVVE